MSEMLWWEMIIGVGKLVGLILIGYGEYRLWAGTTSRTARWLWPMLVSKLAWFLPRASPCTHPRP
ncbi:hypothetical protein J7J55_04840, partial [Candidatus Bipolaricaulota bacterium]|nr:hypothetical protein [Candidatus Bipolaricaulota bacterium]